MEDRSNEPLISLGDVAKRVGLSQNTVKRLKAEPGGIPSYKIGQRVLFRWSEVSAWIDAQKVEVG